MGKGDKKSKRGKISMGSFGVSRPKRKKTVIVEGVEPKAAKVKKTVPAGDDKPKKKVAKKKTEE